MQEHGLYKSQFKNKYGIDVSKHRASAMNEAKMLRCRPRGGTVILWKGSLNLKVILVEYDSQGVCAVTGEIHGTRIVLVSVYM